MKTIFVLGLFSLFSMTPLVAQDVVWLTDMNQAKEIAKRENKTILVDFTGSDWCGWCKRLDKEVFNQPDFAAFAKEKLVMLKVDFPRFTQQTADLKKKNETLLNKYQVEGFPTILLLNADEKVLLTTGYVPGGAKAYVDHLKASM